MLSSRSSYQQQPAALQSLARQHQLTLNTLVQGVWALLLSRYSSQKDVVFGATSWSSGGIGGLRVYDRVVYQHLAGASARDSSGVSSALAKAAQAQQVELLEYEYSPLRWGWSEVPRGVPLFESIMVFENYP